MQNFAKLPSYFTIAIAIATFIASFVAVLFTKSLNFVTAVVATTDVIASVTSAKMKFIAAVITAITATRGASIAAFAFVVRPRVAYAVLSIAVDLEPTIGHCRCVVIAAL